MPEYANIFLLRELQTVKDLDEPHFPHLPLLLLLRHLTGKDIGDLHLRSVILIRDLLCLLVCLDQRLPLAAETPR